MGSASQPYSQPVHTLTVQAYRIGDGPGIAYPREKVPERRNAQATDATWNDAPELAPGDTIMYPWGTLGYDAANFEETGLHQPVSVGVFPQNVSKYGCYDITGNVWEWYTTLWGNEMSTPSFEYPWKNDAREDSEALGEIYRVLRGGCFSRSYMYWINAMSRDGVEAGFS
ncbi:hypothetical protein CC80DRAFT_510706 [Byssothecium circinans]|uniref:Sulfatase-modifying factor enzyme-like domain-containing protein n=1 Tax=Byssothecium circinans TaxID=147558 RepID=A0A6A5T944_9PLEO|nr:hypothetical protein CC80DRAFT_510706 [Byssothecium circinans]